jgi:glutamate N-acetyltransferase/amino-acid N-acetyltransferase
VLVGSTGRIGVTMPMANVKPASCTPRKMLGHDRHAAEAAEAIMTSDTKPKQIAVEFKLGGKTVRIGGICKGAGMIQPGMSPPARARCGLPPTQGLHATMLCFITTDAAIEAKPSGCVAGSRRPQLQPHHRRRRHEHERHGAGAGQWPRGQSENSSVPRAGRKRRLKTFQRRAQPRLPRPREDDRARWRRRASRRDGAGRGREEFADADAAARAVANSSLVKTSWHGGDPNWGRIIDALGYSPATIVEEKVDIGYSAPGSRKKFSGASSAASPRRPPSRISAPPPRRRNSICTSA